MQSGTEGGIYFDVPFDILLSARLTYSYALSAWCES